MRADGLLKGGTLTKACRSVGVGLYYTFDPIGDDMRSPAWNRALIAPGMKVRVVATEGMHTAFIANESGRIVGSVRTYSLSQKVRLIGSGPSKVTARPKSRVASR